MNINKTQTKSRIVILAILGITVVGCLACLYHFKLWPFTSTENTDRDRPVNSVDYTPPTDSQQDIGNEAKKRFNDRQVQSNNSDPVNPTDTTVQISSSQINNGTLQVRTVLSVIDESGTCTLRLTKDDSEPTITSASTKAMGSYSTCQGFDIDMSGRPFGIWKVDIEYTGIGQSGTTTREILYENTRG